MGAEVCRRLYQLNLPLRGQQQVQAKKGFVQSLNITPTVGDTTTANMVLKVAGQTETVNVSTEASRLIPRFAD